MTEHPVYRVRSLRKDRSTRFSLSVPELDIFGSEVLCLLGPTGAGKSTLLRILAAVESPTSGQVAFQGHPLDREPLPRGIRRRTATVFQRPLLLSATVAYNVQYGLRLRGQRRAPDRVSDLVRRLRLDSIADQSAQELSGGQQQLVAFARALVVEPDALLLDEPTANLDPAHVALVEEVLAEERRRRSLTVVWSTHNLFQARRVADRVALLWDGACVEIGPRKQFFESPRSPHTKAFLEGNLVY